MEVRDELVTIVRPGQGLAVSGQRAGHTLTCVGATGAVLGGINDTEAPSLASGSSSMVMFGGYDRDRRTCHNDVFLLRASWSSPKEPDGEGFGVEFD